MEKGILEGESSGLRCPSLAHGRVMKMGCRFCDPPKDEPDAHARAEEHGKPGEEVKFGFGSVRAQEDIAVSRKDETEGGN